MSGTVERSQEHDETCVDCAGSPESFLADITPSVEFERQPTVRSSQHRDFEITATIQCSRAAKLNAQSYLSGPDRIICDLHGRAWIANPGAKSVLPFMYQIGQHKFSHLVIITDYERGPTRDVA